MVEKKPFGHLATYKKLQNSSFVLPTKHKKFLLINIELKLVSKNVFS